MIRTLFFLLVVGTATCGVATSKDDREDIIVCEYQDTENMRIYIGIYPNGTLWKQVYFQRGEINWDLILSEKVPSENELYHFVINEGQPPHRWKVQIFKSDSDRFVSRFTYLDLDPASNEVAGLCEVIR